MTVPETLAMIPCILWNVELKFRDVSNGLCGNMPTIVIAIPNIINGSRGFTKNKQLQANYDQ